MGDGAETAKEFQPTLPVRGVTLTADRFAPREIISTHTPRAGSDRALEVTGSEG